MIKKINLEIKDNENEQNNQPNILTKSKLCLYMEKGLDIEGAAKLCGISNYMLSVYRSDPEFEEFVQECQVKCEESNLDNIKDAGDNGIWNASAWILERKFPDKYAKKDTVRHEYDFKLSSLLQLIFKAVNQLEPFIRQSFMQKLNDLDVDGEIIQLQEQQLIEYTPEKVKGQATG